MCRNFCWEFPLAPYTARNPVLLQENRAIGVFYSENDVLLQNSRWWRLKERHESIHGSSRLMTPERALCESLQSGLGETDCSRRTRSLRDAVQLRSPYNAPPPNERPSCVTHGTMWTHKISQFPS